MSQKKSNLQEDHVWLSSQNLAQYAGSWLAVFGRRIIASGKNLEIVVKKVREKNINDEAPLYVRVPEGLLTI